MAVIDTVVGAATAFVRIENGPDRVAPGENPTAGFTEIKALLVER
jgi:hypothetical protein